jgi:hypothetical protein
MRLAESEPAPAYHRKRAHNVLAITLFWFGELVSARMYFECGLALDEPQQRSVIDYGQDASCGSWVIPIRRCARARKRSPPHGRWRIRIVWRSCCISRPGCINSAAR